MNANKTPADQNVTCGCMSNPYLTMFLSPRLPIRNLRVEIDIRVDLQAFELRTVMDRRETLSFLFLLPVLVGLRDRREVEVLVVVSHVVSLCCTKPFGRSSL